MHYPSFKNKKPGSSISSETKKKNSCKDTKHERILRSELHRIGLRFRKHVTSLPGKPDIVFGKARVIVFCDGDFWHGRNWEILRKKLKHRKNSEYWEAKIAANRERDRQINQELAELGWRVIRVWETDILKDSRFIARRIDSIVRHRSS